MRNESQVIARKEPTSPPTPMFEDVFLDKIKTRRKSSTVVSFLLQIILVAIVVLIPLIFTQAIPLKTEMSTILVAPPPPPPPPPPAASQPQPVKPVTSEIAENHLLTPTKIPKQVAMIKESAAPPPTAPGVMGGVPGGVPGGQAGGVVGGVIGAIPTAAPKLVAPQRVHVSQGVTEGMLIHKVVPQYPPVAQEAHVQGAVQLHAVIGKDGKVKEVQVVSGSPMLVQAAESAVKQWQYKPYFLNGQPVEVDTNITVNFTLHS